MHPWVEAQIRLAERMGLLQGPRLTSVHLRAIEILERVDTSNRQLEDEQRRFHDFRLAILSNPNLVENMDRVWELFPEWSIDSKPRKSVEEEVLSDSTGEVIFTQEVSFEEAQQILGTMDMSELTMEYIEDAVSPYGDEGWQ